MSEVDAAVETKPDSSWTPKKLAIYAAHHLNREVALGRKSAVTVFRAGHALSLLRANARGRKLWVRYQKKHNFARSTVNHAIRVFEYFKDESKLGNMTITEAKREAGVIRRKTQEGEAGSRPRRYVLAEPTPKNAANVMGRALDVIEAALVAAKEADDDVKVELEKLFDRGADLFRKTKAKDRHHAASANGH